MKKKIVFLIIILVVAITAVASFFVYKQYNDKNVIATINGKKVNVKEFNFMLEAVKDNMTQNYGITDFNQEIDGKKKYYLEVAKEQAWDSIVNNKLAYQQAVEKDVEMSAEEVKDMNENLNSIEQNPDFQKRLEKVGLSMKQFKEMYEEMVLSSKVFTDKEAEDYYNKNKKDYLFQEEQVRARHILFKTIDEAGNALSEEKQTEIKTKAETVLQKAKLGEDFALLAKQYTEDEGSKDNGGEYTFPKGQMVKEFEDVAFTLNPGEISGLVKTEYGYHIIKVEEKYKAGDQMKFTSTKDKVLSDLYTKSLESWKKESQIVKNDKLYNSI